MRSVELQTVHAQTPAVERAFLNRQAQSGQEQRLASVLQRETADQKIEQTQETEHTENPNIRPEKEAERRNRKGKKNNNDQPEENEQEVKTARRHPGRIDILV